MSRFKVKKLEQAEIYNTYKKIQGRIEFLANFGTS